MATKKRPGRPTKYNQKLAEEICRRLAEGEPFVSICAEKRMPDFSTIWRWEQSNPEFCDLCARALEHGSHYLAHDCLRIADDESIDPRHKRLMIDTRLRLIGKWNSKRYGDKVQVDQRTELSEATQEEVQEALRLKFQQMVARGTDVVKILREAGVELESPQEISETT